MVAGAFDRVVLKEPLKFEAITREASVAEAEREATSFKRRSRKFAGFLPISRLATAGRANSVLRPSGISHVRGADRACSPRTTKGRIHLLNSSWAMQPDLRSVLETLRTHEADLRAMGVSHAAVFGSVTRGDAIAGSDIDVLVELDDSRPMGIFEYARMKLYINDILTGPSDVVNRRTLKPLIRANILRDAVHAF